MECHEGYVFNSVKRVLNTSGAKKSMQLGFRYISDIVFFLTPEEQCHSVHF